MLAFIPGGDGIESGEKSKRNCRVEPRISEKSPQNQGKNHIKLKEILLATLRSQSEALELSHHTRSCLLVQPKEVARNLRRIGVAAGTGLINILRARHVL